ncbi:putative 4-hydroxy-4-methyl-2-oxoglutarate aldolase [Shewanella sp. NIFS-20-20]|uniref:putative 4-hydroxy-4-methyl-2-oxoglutarate aldolase n=1 Tax=Shewanella sp. NIFS-20-20 TaxID=2853806 RepID=UPI001C4922CA|nr:putative 4-hydroxy-4-methyl-2-oxoglutarate aldolase [Shewanella sp. NIFS-20-20]MBV7315068.1 putative 4-hydroxy-4-methyl-2-oxoglutarate aldolase [Shewanella sp. NIFS-20-20]
MQDILPDLCDEYPDQVNVFSPIFQHYGGVTHFSGELVTVKCFEDNSMVKQLLATPGHGRVLVVDGGGSVRRALLGDMIATEAVAQGWAGIVIYGAVRDVVTLATLPLGVCALAACPIKTAKLGQGEIGVPIVIDGINVLPGMHIYADPNGVLIAKGALDTKDFN